MEKVTVQIGYYEGSTVEVERWRTRQNIWLPRGVAVVTGRAKIDNWGRQQGTVTKGEYKDFLYKLYMRKHAIGIVYNPDNVELTVPPLQAEPPDIGEEDGKT